MSLPLPFHCHPSLIFAGKAGAYQSGVPGGTPSLACKNLTRVKVSVNGMHSGLLQNGNNRTAYITIRH
jgi:hypothetical protein